MGVTFGYSLVMVAMKLQFGVLVTNLGGVVCISMPLRGSASYSKENYSNFDLFRWMIQTFHHLTSQNSLL